ncbi:MAG: adenosylmethionine--8-amino-7-oxononanoate transaminase [Dehalococcoidia bacterium]|nr:adenosylmethionine--8-amino-7-oxononanoate transaminase [Dehalococcoidia bacterium]
MDKKTYTSRTQDLERLDKEYVWHPFTQMADWQAEDQVVIASGEGNYLIDTEGRRYIDGVSSLWVNVHGHRRREIDLALMEQLSRIAHSTFLGLTHEPAIRLAEKLAGISPPGLSKTFFSDNGSTAVEVALKTAYQYWQQRDDPQPARKRFISFTNGYHGDTLGSVSVGGIDLFHQVYKPLLFDAIQVPSAYCYRCYLKKEFPSCGMSCLADVEEAMSRCRGEAAAVIMEPLVQGAGGMIVFPPGYTAKVRELAAKYGILFIADEVATGFGRTGSMFACQQEGITPDFMAAAKGITGGYLPLAVTMTTPEIFNAFCGEYKEKKTFFHGHTYTANPLACAAALANLAIFEREKTIETMQPKIEWLKENLQALYRLSHVGDVRQAGFMIGIELIKDRDSKEPYPYEEKIGIKVIQTARKKGLIIRPLGDVIVLMPPLTITDKQLREILEKTYDSIKEVTGA